MNKNETKANEKSTFEKNVWSIGKALSLIIASCALFAFITCGSPVASNLDAYASTDEGVNVDISHYNSNGTLTLDVPYTSIYDININDRQLVSVVRYIDPDVVKLVADELPKGTPNEFLLRCAYYTPSEVEDALNMVLGVTLSANWRTYEYYVDTQVNQQIYSTNGQAVNGYGDN